MTTSTLAPNLATVRGARYALFILTFMNLLNYLDRYVPSVVKDLFKKDLNLNDMQTSAPITGFVIVYMLTSPIFGALADRWPRKVLIAGGVALWSFATGAAAFATGFWTFVLARALVGVGEAAYATLSPAMLSDFYAPARRNRALMVFYVAVPLGSAMGFVFGGLLGQHYGWRAAFLICGFPGIAIALLALFIREPGRGTLDGDAGTKPPRWPEAVNALLKNRSYLQTVAGYTAVTFAAGALADWFPVFLQRYRGMTLEEAGRYVGLSAVVGGLAGTFAGGMVGDALKRWTRQPYLALSGWSMALATIFGTLAIFTTNRVLLVVMLFLAQFCLWCYNGPINALLANSVSSALRARSFALTILVIHMFGDAISPVIVGAASDALGKPGGPGLSIAIQLVPITMGIGALIWLHAWRKLPEPPATAPSK